MVVNEEVARAGATSFNMTLGLQDDLVLAYLLDLTDEEQKKRWLAPLARGELLGALAMTEPGTGSDLRGIRTNAHRVGHAPDAHWILNGQKTFISSAITADSVIVAARTNPAAGSRGFSLFVVERDMPGFHRGRKLDKVGLHGQDTGELYFEDVRVPASNLIGTEGQGMMHLMSHLPQERLGIIASAYAGARAVYQHTARYCFERTAFGQAIGDFQNSRFALAEIETELDVAEAFVDRCVLAFNAGELSPTDAAKGKWYLSELQKRVVDRCMQLHGGYGYMLEYPVARAFVDTRVQTIDGGTTEIMKELIGRDIAKRNRP
jgi:alkylation response protein AidB-like acyl-CoA dehydrogenase